MLYRENRRKMFFEIYFLTIPKYLAIAILPPNVLRGLSMAGIEPGAQHAKCALLALN